MIARHYDAFENKNLLVSGECQDSYTLELPTASTFIHCNQYHEFCYLTHFSSEKKQIEYSMLPTEHAVNNADVFIYYWPKNKREAIFELSYYFSVFKENMTNVLIVGENRSGVKSIEKLFPKNINVRKIDSARHCTLYQISLLQSVDFNIDAFWHSESFSYQDVKLTLSSLPATFSQKKIDEGTQFLLSVMQDEQKNIKGDVLDIGCGCGVLGLSMALINPSIKLILSDINSHAITSTERNIKDNKINNATVVASDVFLNIQQQFDVIVSNPPFHDGIKTDYRMFEQLLNDAMKHLKPNGYFYFVANSFLPYESMLNKIGISYVLLNANTKYKVYKINKI